MSRRTLVRCATVLTGVLAVAILGVAGLIAWRNYRSAHSLLEADPPSKLLASPRLAGVAGLTAVSFVSADRLRLAAWYVPSRNGAAVVLAHGTNSDRSSMLPEIRLLADAGFGVLAFDWPGLGESEGEVRWDGQARRALTAAVDWLASRSEVDPGRMGGLGFSIGGYVLTQVAAQDPRLRAVVLEAPPPSFEDYMQVHARRWGYLSYWPAWLAIHNSGLLDHAFDALRLIPRIAPRAVLLLGGTKDTEIPSPLVSRMFAAAGNPKAVWIVDGAGHGNYSSVAGAQYATRLTAFFNANLRDH
ncbi:MAG TPA: alpha/beta fold hydrolase [Steroidobacteraceae bacterium]|nr:alpha/beta fold hydrolase [Steroidobacteraceae bacterium]